MTAQNNDLEKAKEILRQGELRVKGILDFSKEIDDKIFKLLASSIAIASGLLFFLLKDYAILTLEAKLISWSLISILMLSIVFLIQAGKPNSYIGTGLPLKLFDKNSYEQVLNKSKEHYKETFAHNRDLNKAKVKWLNKAILLLAYSPALITTIWFLRNKIFYVLSYFKAIQFPNHFHRLLVCLLYFLIENES